MAASQYSYYEAYDDYYPYQAYAELQATIPADMLANPGQLAITVSTPGSEGSTSDFIPFTVTDSLTANTTTTTPLTVTPVAVSAVAGEDISPIVAHVSIPASSNDDLQAIIDWGDGTSPQPATLVDEGDGSYDVVGDHTYAASGFFQPTISVTADASDGSGSNETTVNGSAEVVPQTLTGNELTVQEDDSLTLAALGTFTDDSAADLVATINWGDGSASDYGVVLGDTGTLTVAGSHTYDKVGTFLADVQVTDDGDVVATGYAAVTVTPIDPSADLTVTMTPPTTYEAGASSGMVTLATFTDSNPASTAGRFGALIDWGDGSPLSQGEVVGGDGGFEILGEHTYADTGSYVVGVTLTDPTRSVLSRETALVEPASLDEGDVYNFTVVAGTLYSDLALGTFTSNDPNETAADYEATIVWGDGTTSPAEVVGSGGHFVVAASPEYSDADAPQNQGSQQYNFEIEIQELNTAGMPDGKMLQFGGTATVAAVAVGTPIPNLTLLTFTDANPDADDPSVYTAWVYWGDGTAVAGVPVGQDAYGFTVDSGSAGGHTYSRPGQYNIDVQVGEYDDSLESGTGEVDYSLIDYYDDYGDYYYYDYYYYDYYYDYYYGDQYGDFAPIGVSGEQSITVGAQPLLAGADAGPIHTTVGTPLADEVVGYFADPNTSVGSVSSFTATLNWGDGSNTDTVATVVPIGTSNDGTILYEVLGSHAYETSGSFQISALIQSSDGQTLVTATDADVSPTDVSQWPLTAQQLTNDPSQAELVPAGEATVALNTGGLRLSQPLSFDQSSSADPGGDAALVYNSDTAQPRPIIESELTSEGPEAPTEIQVQLVWNGVPQGWVTYDPAGHSPGDAYLLNAQVDDPVAVSGVYDWTLEVEAQFADGTKADASTSGQAVVVANTQSPYGSGWGLQSTSRLVFSSAGVLLIQGSGDSTFFTANADGTYTSPAGEFGTLTANPSNPDDFIYTTPDQTSYFYNSEGELTDIVDRDLVTTQYTWTNGLLTQVLTPGGGVTTFSYSGDELHSIVEPGSRTVTLNQSNYALESLVDAAGYTRSFAYAGGLLVRDNWGVYDSTFEYDPDTGVLTAVELGTAESFLFTPAVLQGFATAGAPGGDAGLATVTDGMGDETSYLLNAAGEPLAETLPGDAGTLTWVRDGNGLVTEATDADGIPTFYGYDSAGDVTSIDYANGSSDVFEYDSVFHQLNYEKDADGNVTIYGIDPSNGDTISMTDSDADTTYFQYTNGLLTEETDPDGGTTTYVYNSSRQLIEEIDPSGATAYATYDAAGDLLTSTDGDGNVTKYTYDGDGNVLSTTTAYGTSAATTTSNTYSADGSVLSSTDGDGNVTAYTYDAAGNVLTTTTGYGTAGAQTTSAVYNGAGELTASTDPDGNLTTGSYTPDGYLASMTTAFGTSAAATATYTYDDDGNVLTMTDPDGNVTSDIYNNMGEVLSATTGFGTPAAATTQNTYDGDGNLLTTTDPDGNVTKYTYDDDGNVLTVTTGYGSPAAATTTNTYDKDGNLLTERKGVRLGFA